MSIPGILYQGLGTLLYERFALPPVAALHQAAALLLAERLPPRTRVVDIGCGPGELLVRLGALRDDLDLIGIDPVRRAIARSRRRVRAAGVRARLVREGVDGLVHAVGRFGCAVAIGSIKHWPDPAAGLLAVAGAMAPGGKLYIWELDPGGAARMEDVNGTYAQVSRRVLAQCLLPSSLPRVAMRDLIVGAGLVVEDEGVVAGMPFYWFIARHG
ncbi:MAG: methyltransferase domain-containing protein [Planctomycetes bacterium]|nr:methyltransferase domain-containing protein [Planctomycetota bacterium]